MKSRERNRDDKVAPRADMRWFAVGVAIGMMIGLATGSPFIGLLCAGFFGSIFMLYAHARSGAGDQAASGRE